MIKYTLGWLLLITTILYNRGDCQQGDIVIDIDFPGGNIIVVDNDNISTLYYDITGDTVFLRPDLRDTEGNWFYWYFRVTGAAGKKLDFIFPGRHISNFGPATSNDGGESWKWLYDDIQDTFNQFSYTFGPDENEVRFSSTIPYLQADFDAFISCYFNNPYFSMESLTASEKGRKVEKLNIGCPRNDPEYRVLITARHHAGESIASYVLEGIISSVLDGGESTMKWLRDHVEFLIVPFMDKDGVEDGDQGKNRRPYDHNRDYSGRSIYNSVAALREEVLNWSEGKLRVAFDLHCPYISGGEWNENIYFVGSADRDIAKEQKKYVDILTRRASGELIINPQFSLLEYGTAWNVSRSFSQGLSFSRWAATIEEISFAATLEIPFAYQNGQKVTPENARLFGKDMADALSIYLQEL